MKRRTSAGYCRILLLLAVLLPGCGGEQADTREDRVSTEVMILPGLVADRSVRSVTIRAETTGIREHEPVEFLLIGEGSGHGYEALATSSATPGDIHKALTFIGMKPGRPVSPRKFRFWPKGDRVRMDFVLGEDGGRRERIPVERLLLHSETQAAAPEMGLVFAGSRIVSRGTETNAYAADVRDPRSIASTYNEADTVLDVPWRAPQNSVYGQYVVNPDSVLPRHEPVEVVLTPADRQAAELILVPEVDTESADLKDLRFTLREQTGRVVASHSLLHDLRQELLSLSADRDIFLVLRLHDQLTLTAARNICALLQELEDAGIVRIEPPDSGQLYYKAFLPREDWRGRDDRMAQPWELHLKMEKGSVTAVLTQIEEIWKDGEVRPELKISHHAIPKPEALGDKLKQLGPGLPVILTFATPTITHGQLMTYLAPVRSTHGTVHVFLE